jgi:hypothetical protein
MAEVGELASELDAGADLGATEEGSGLTENKQNTSAEDKAEDPPDNEADDKSASQAAPVPQSSTAQQKPEQSSTMDSDRAELYKDDPYGHLQPVQYAPKSFGSVYRDSWAIAVIRHI